MAQESSSHAYKTIYTIYTPVDVLPTPLVVLIEEETDIRHIDASPFCFSDSRCPCHEDPQLIVAVLQQVAEGLLTLEEATRTVKGEML